MNNGTAIVLNRLFSILQIIAAKKAHINGIGNFWGVAKMRSAKFRDLSQATLRLHLKEW